MTGYLRRCRYGLLLWLAVAFLFYVANRGAYEGYFAADDIDTMSWTVHGAPFRWLGDLANPVVAGKDLRPIPHAYFGLLGHTAGLNFRAYVAVLHLLHLINFALLWGILLKLGAPFHARVAGAAVFAFHMAAFSVYWQPMWIYDVFCATFLLAALLLYLHDRWLLALVPFWLAFHSKELAATLPAALLVYEWLLGERRWRRVLPFLGITLALSLQAVLLNARTDDAYTLRFTPGAIFTCVNYYAGAILYLPFAGFALLPLAWFVKDPRVRFGLLLIPVLLGPLLFLPGRLFPAYIYLPAAGLAIAAAFLAAPRHWRWTALFLLLWIPGNYMLMRAGRKAELTAANERRVYMAALDSYISAHPGATAVVASAAPGSMPYYGVQGALRWFARRLEINVWTADRAAAARAASPNALDLIHWNPVLQQLSVVSRRPGDPLASFLVMEPASQVWQLADGWLDVSGHFRWTRPRATASLYRPAGANEFSLTVLLPEVQLTDLGRLPVEVLLDGRSIGQAIFAEEGVHTLLLPLDTAPPGQVRVEFRSPAYVTRSGGPPLGAAIVAFGFAGQDGIE